MILFIRGHPSGSWLAKMPGSHYGCSTRGMGKLAKSGRIVDQLAPNDTDICDKIPGNSRTINSQNMQNKHYIV